MINIRRYKGLYFIPKELKIEEIVEYTAPEAWLSSPEIMKGKSANTVVIPRLSITAEITERKAITYTPAPSHPWNKLKAVLGVTRYVLFKF